MGLIEGVALFDVDNVEAFIQRALDKSAIHYEPEDREELLALGWTEFYELACKYKPLPEPPCGYEQWFQMTLDDRQVYEAKLHTDTVKRGSFSGHAAMFFPRRFGDAWHKMHPEHRYITDPVTGKRGWSYQQPMVSLDALYDGSANGRKDGAEEWGDRQLLNARSITAFCHTATLTLATAGIR